MLPKNKTTLYWFTPECLKDLRKVLNSIYEINDTLDDIYVEVNVAPLRAQASNVNLKSLTLALSLPINSIPLHFTDEEQQYILSSSDDIPQTVKEALQ